MEVVSQLQEIRDFGGAARTSGLSDQVVERFARRDTLLAQAIAEATEAHRELRATFGDLLELDESGLQQALQADYVNFYPDSGINPYVTLAARGPWIVTVKGAVLHDCGGYGMLGFGHAPEPVLAAMARPHVMANVMSPNFSQLRFARALRSEIGSNRGEGCPFDRFLCLNSGSEAVTLGARISDINAKLHTDPGGRHAGKGIRMVSLKGGFHGRTDRPAQYSDSTRDTYLQHLASFRDRDNLITVEPNNIEHLQQVFEYADRNGLFIESMFMEPVMGEGDPGRAISPEFFAEARRLTEAHGSLLLVDSIQAGLRAHGCLSICDYPGFEQLDPPDMESYSKALNAGQYPLSVLALTHRAAALYRKGVYGNTMTTNPRALEVGCAVLDRLTPELRANIRRQGEQFLTRLRQLQTDLEGAIVQVQGTGLLFSIELDPQRYKAYGTDSVEEYLRLHGINVIHGGENSLRYTPHFAITDEEVELIVERTREALLHGPAKAAQPAAA